MPAWIASDFTDHLQQERPDCKAALEELLIRSVCARCCLRFLGITSFGSDRSTLSRCFPTASEVLSHLRTHALGEELAQVDKGTDGLPEPTIPWTAGVPGAAVTCPACAGILQTFESSSGAASEALMKAAISKLDLQPNTAQLSSGSAEHIAETLRGLGYEGETYALELCIPAACAVRDVAILRHLARQGLQSVKRGLEVLVDLKDALRMMLTGPLTAATGLRHDKAAVLRVCMAYMNPEAASDAEFLTNKEWGRPRKRKKPWMPLVPVGRAATAATWTLLEGLAEDAPLGNVAVPPPSPSIPPCVFLSVKRASLYVGGWYTKLGRDISNSPFFLDGQRKGRTSVEEEIAGHLLPAFYCDGHKFMSAGREDMDVRMLGAGRPFAFEVQNARKCVFTAAFFRDVEARLQQADSGVQARGLQMLDKSQLSAMKDGEREKQKSYRALCWLPVEVTDEQVSRLTSDQELVLKQTTPTRVAHRRALLDRQRSVYSIRCEKVPNQPQHCLLFLRTQAGTYIKEFVHGDEGRTQPNVSMLLGTSEPCKCLELDVEEIHMDWI